MWTISQIQPGMEVIGADSTHVGTIELIEGDRIRLRQSDSGEGSHRGHSHYIPLGLVAEVEGDEVRLSSNADASVLSEEEKSGVPVSDMRA